jgi:hypothetical protein
MDKKGESPWSIIAKIIKLGVVILLLAGLTQILWGGDTVQNLLMLAKGIGICAGVIVLALGALAIYFRLFARESGSKVLLQSREYPTRCCLINSLKTPSNLLSTISSEERIPETVYSVYLLCAVTNYGISLSEISGQYSWGWIPTDIPSRFSQLHSECFDSIILPMGYFHLYYVLDNQEGALPLALTTLSDDGFTGSISDLPAEYNMSIIIVSTGFMKPDDLKIITREQPLKLKLVALDQIGHEDWSAPRQLYDFMFQWARSSDTDEDDSWMYRSRPILW